MTPKLFPRRLLLKCLRPVTVPSPNRKHLSFGTRIRLEAYRKCLKVLRKWYGRYAFSDVVTLPGRPQTKVVHEFRDLSFEAELKRLRIQVPENTIVRNRQASARKRSFGCLPHFRDFRFVDTMTLVIGGQRIAVSRGLDDSFSSTLNGILKETDENSLIRKYIFTASAPSQPEQRPSRTKAPSFTSISDNAPSPEEDSSGPKPLSPRASDPPHPERRRKQGPLFKDDPLLGMIREQPAPSPLSTPEEKPIPTTRAVAGVIIDESF